MTDPAPPSSRITGVLLHLRAHRGPLLAAWLFPIIAILTATLFLGGNLGKSTDDYSINLRDPVTNAVPSPFNPLHRYPFFWRPLHNILCFGVGTLWPDANRSVHVAVAAFHALSCLGLFLLLRELTRTRLAPAVAALVFAVYPLHGEVAFWFCTTSTSIGAAIFFAAALLAVRYARARTHSVGLLPAIFILFFLITCFYEQSAAPAVVIPFIVLACSPRLLGWPARITRAALASLAAGLACIAYLVLLISTAPPKVRGGSGSFVTASRLADRFQEFVSGISYVMFAERAGQIVRGSITLGWQTLHSPLGLVAAAALFATAVLWLIWATRRGGLRPVLAATTEPRNFVWLFTAGIATFVAGWLPVFLIDRQVIELRNTYVPLLGVAIALAALLDAMLSRQFSTASRLPSAIRFTTAIFGIAAAAIGIIALVGFQSFLQARWKQDQREIATLKLLVPNPPPNTVFVPFRTNATATHTGYIMFDRARLGVFETPWSAHHAIIFAYHRNDVSATASSPWMPPPHIPLDKPDVDGARWTRGLTKSMMKLFPRDPEGGHRIPWTNMVSFLTEPSAQGNELKLIRRFDAERPDHRDLEIRPPLVHAAIDAARAAGTPCPTTTFRFPASSAPSPELISIDFWEYADGTPGQFINVHPWNVDHKATWLACGPGPRGSMSVQMPPLDRPENLLIRATIAEYDLDPARNPIARTQELVVTMASAPTKELAVLKLDPIAIRAQKRWLPLIVPIPIRPPPAGDRIVVSLRLTEDPPVRTDPADKSPIPADAKVATLPVWMTHGYEQSIVAP